MGTAENNATSQPAVSGLMPSVCSSFANQPRTV